MRSEADKTAVYEPADSFDFRPSDDALIEDISLNFEQVDPYPSPTTKGAHRDPWTALHDAGSAAESAADGEYSGENLYISSVGRHSWENHKEWIVLESATTDIGGAEHIDHWSENG
ncbi:MAG: hypothetical protein AAF577_14240 [Pseudomonadota bacterium]